MCEVTDILISSVGEFFHNVYVCRIKSAYYVLNISSEWVKVAHLCLTLCDPMDYTVHGILQATILEWVAIPFSRGSSQTRDQTQVSHIADEFFTSWATREAPQLYFLTMPHKAGKGKGF